MSYNHDVLSIVLHVFIITEYEEKMQQKYTSISQLLNRLIRYGFLVLPGVKILNKYRKI